MNFRHLREQWFLIGMALVTALALWNPAHLVDHAGPFLQRIHAQEWGLALIFILSGLELHVGHILDALRDWRGVCLSMLATFLLAPLLAWGLSRVAPSQGIAIGLCIIGVVSTTQASGIVMSGAAGGSAAHALLISILSNMVCIFTIPAQLQWLTGQHALHVELPWLSTSLKLGALIVLPLLAGMALRQPLAPTLAALPFRPSVLSRGMILVFIFMGLCAGRASIMDKGNQVVVALALVLALHLSLVIILWITLRALGRGQGRRESIFFMGIQKTLPQAIWLQTTYFSSYGMALVVCVLYHISQLVVDSYFVGRLAKKQSAV